MPGRRGVIGIQPATNEGDDGTGQPGRVCAVVVFLLAGVAGQRGSRVDTPFAVDVVDVVDTVLLRVSGELDLHTAPQLDRLLSALHCRPCELDLVLVSFADSTAVNLLLRHRRRAAESGGSLRVVAVSRTVRRVLDVTGTTALLLVQTDPPDSPADSARG
ncbi:STAS domain-containing protein [Streptomyces bobili]|uniref:STAS domain-containing protein n=1 Tax=Streptomyces bobili TaxID=67280 RepID=UPI00343CF035